jgi:hypothetical protein
VSTPAYLIAHRAVPIQAGSQPKALWDALSGPEWSSWLAMIGMKLGIEVRHIGIEGMATGKPIITRDGVEMIFMYFPAPEATGEPYYAVIAREVGATKLRAFVFERGATTPEEPVRVVMAEWTYQGPDNVMRMRFDATADASLDACITRTVEIMNEHRGRAPAHAPGPSAGMRAVLIGLAVLVGLAVVGLVVSRL